MPSGHRPFLVQPSAFQVSWFVNESVDATALEKHGEVAQAEFGR